MAQAMEKPVLNEFFAKRARLITELQTAAQRITAWWADRENSDPSLQDLAMLEGMLAERKTLLERMMQLDDKMLGELVRVRGQRDSS